MASTIDDEDEDLKAAIAMSLETMSAPSTSTHVNSIDSAASSNRSSGFAGLDRQAMERERLARQASRKRQRESPISPPPLRSPWKAPKLEATTVDMPSGAKLNFFSTLVQQDQAGRKTGVANAATANLKAETSSIKPGEEPLGGTHMPAQGELAYPNGVVKKTWAFGHDRTGDEIKLEEVLEPRTLKTALISAFQWDPDWILSKLKVPPDGSTKCIFVMQAKDEALRKQMREQTEDKRAFLRLCFPPMEGQVHCMHSKLMLLFHTQKLRIAIPTANLLNFDWGETGRMENSCFIIDLPRLPKNPASEADIEMTCFGKELLYFLEKQGVDQDVRIGVLGFDFTTTKDMAFVHTVGGIMYGADAERTGLPGLGEAVRQLGLQTDNLEIDFAASSIGSLNDDYLRATHAAAKGVSLIAQATADSSKAKADFFKASAKKSTSATQSIRDKIRIYFPTKETVTSSTAGAAGTICLSRKWYENMPFPRAVFRDYVSVRTGLLSHNKILYARGKCKTNDVAWAYVGSANMSESAWGKLVYDKKAKAWKINCRNWECGVLLPVSAKRLEQGKVNAEVNNVKVEKAEGEDSETESEEEALDVHEVVSMDVFKGLVDMPFQYPGRSYDGREPWYFQERPR